MGLSPDLIILLFESRTLSPKRAVLARIRRTVKTPERDQGEMQPALPRG
jgi:hypothetical protein